MKYNILKYSAVCSSLMIAFCANAATPEGFHSHGYLAYGVGFTNDEVLNQGAYNWAQTGGNIFKLPGLYHANSSAGRVGNDGNWGQFHGDYGINQNDMNWGAHFMFSSNFSGVGASQTFMPEWVYVDAQGVFPSMPEATVWAGQKYVNRVYTPLVVNEAYAVDGRGFGVENLPVGNSKLDLGLTRDLYNSYGNIKQGNMAIFSAALRGIDLTDSVNMELYANYGTYVGSNRDEEVDSGDTFSDRNPDGFTTGLKFNHAPGGAFSHQAFLRYSSELRAASTRTWGFDPRPSEQIGGFFSGRYQLNSSTTLEYTYSHETAKYDENARAGDGGAASGGGAWAINATESNWDSFIIQGKYNWNTRTTTVVETGYEQIKYSAVNSADDGTNSGYKVTLAQQLHIGNGQWDRPLIYFYLTYAEQDVETYKPFDGIGWASYDDSILGKKDALTAGVMLEAWW